MKQLASAVACACLAAACHSAPPTAGGGRSDAPTAPGLAAGTNADWPAEPTGLSTVSDRPWTTLVGAGWHRRESGNDHLAADDSAPLQPPLVLEYGYPAGFPGGTAPATHYFSLGHRKEVFVGLVWKVSDPWQGHASYVNKVQFLYAGGSDVAMVMYGPPQGPYELRVMPQWPEHDGTWLTPNAARAIPAVGQWHRVEWYLRYESRPGAGDGVIRWWLDGTLAGDYTTLRFPHDDGFVEYQISPTWGGVGDVKRETDFYRFARSYISSR